jgi:DNA-binding beta-propeller fold protein YncE
VAWIRWFVVSERASIWGALALATTLGAMAFSTAAGASQRAYISEIAPDIATPAKIVGYGTNSGGVLTPLSPATTSVGTGEGLGSIAITPDAGHLYVIGKSGALYGFAIGTAGTLTAVPGSPFTIPFDALTAAVTPDGVHLYVTGGSNKISGFSIAANGALTALAGSPFTVPDPPFGLAIAPDGDHLYYTAQGDEDGLVVGMTIAASGALTPIAGAPGTKTIGPDPYAISIAPDGGHLYAVERDSPTSNIWTFSLAADGGMTQVGLPHPVNASGPEPLGSTITPDGKNLYTANADDGTVSGFRFAANGEPIDNGIPFDVNAPASSARPYTVAPNSAGTRLYANENNASDAYSLLLGSSGVLSPLGSAPSVSVVSETGLALTPAQPPTARLSITQSGPRVEFDASASTDAESAIASYSWEFGDGQENESSPAAEQTHTYEPGIYQAKVRVTDADGCSSTYLSSGQTAFCNGSPVAEATVRIDAQPPSLQLSSKSKQPIGDSIKVKALCDESCAAEAKGKLKVKVKGKNKTFKLGTASADLSANTLRSLELSLSKKAQRAARKGNKPKATITVDAVDDPGNVATKVDKVKLED